MKKLLLITSLFTLGFLAVCNVVLSGSYATSGEKLKALEKEKSQLEETIASTQQLILYHTSLTNLEIKADQLGFSRPSKFLTISQPSTSVASSQ